MNRVRCRCSTRCCFWSDCARGSVAVSQGGLTVGGIAKGVQTLWLDSGPTELKTSPSPLNDFLCSVSEAPPRVGVAFNEADRIKTTVPAAGRSCLHLQMEAHICSDVSCHLTHFGSAHASVSLLGKAFNYFNTEFCSWRTFSFVDTDFGNSLRCLLTPLKQVIGSRWQRPVSLTVKLPAQKHSGVDRLAEGLRELYKRGEFTDVALVCADRTFYAHRIVLAAESEVFKSGLASVSKELIDGRQEIRLAEISNPEAVKFMLDYMYQTDASVWEDYNPRTQEINKDVLRLAQTFRLPGLTERAMHWLAKDLTTGNVVEVLTICEDFGLSQLGERILEQLPVESKCF
eukprot:s2675_g6.t2